MKLTKFLDLKIIRFLTSTKFLIIFSQSLKSCADLLFKGSLKICFLDTRPFKAKTTNLFNQVKNCGETFGNM